MRIAFHHIYECFFHVYLFLYARAFYYASNENQCFQITQIKPVFLFVFPPTKLNPCIEPFAVAVSTYIYLISLCRASI